MNVKVVKSNSFDFCIEMISTSQNTFETPSCYYLTQANFWINNERMEIDFVKYWDEGLEFVF